MGYKLGIHSRHIRLNLEDFMKVDSSLKCLGGKTLLFLV
ncbi:(6-4)DNA photolyase [Bienertia sinuspersici]